MKLIQSLFVFGVICVVWCLICIKGYNLQLEVDPNATLPGIVAVLEALAIGSFTGAISLSIVRIKAGVTKRKNATQSAQTAKATQESK